MSHGRVLLVAFTIVQEIGDFWNHTMDGLEKASDVFWRTGACQLWMTEARAEVQKATAPPSAECSIAMLSYSFA